MHRRFGPLGAALALAACGGHEEPGELESVGRAHAFVTIDRAQDADDEAASSGALAGVALVHGEADAAALDALVGSPVAPALGTCARPGLPPALADEGTELTLLDVDAVELRAGELREVLAPNAFPDAHGITGLVYATRDLALTLPAGVPYEVVLSAPVDAEPITLRGSAPASLSDITVNGQPLDARPTVTAGDPVDVTWAVGESGDQVLLQWSDAEGELWCAFADDDGAATLPGGEVSGEGTSRLTLHRVRVDPVELADGGTGVLRFAFRVGADVAVVPPER